MKAVVSVDAEVRFVSGPPRGAFPPLMPPQLHPTHLTSTKTSETTRLRVDCEVLVGE